MADWQWAMAPWAMWSIGLILAAAVAVSIHGSRRASAARRLLVLFGNLLAALVLGLLLSEPRAPAEASGTATLVTPGGADGRGGFVLAENSGKAASGRFVDDIAAVVRQVPALAELRVLGDGLPAAAWKQHADLSIVHLPGEQLPGLVDLQWDTRSPPGRTVSVRGRLQDNNPADWRIRVLGIAEQPLAESRTDADGQFTLSFVPKVSGPRLFSLEAVRPGTPADAAPNYSGPLPVVVLSAPRLSIGMLLSRPSFEAAALGRWLETLNPDLSTRIQLSPGIDRTERRGDDMPDLDVVDQGDLSRLHLLVTDGGMLMAVTEGEREQLMAAIRAGLGVLVLADRELLEVPAAVLAGLNVGDRGSTARIRVAGSDREVTRAAVGISGAPSEVLASAANGEALVVARAVGRGVLAVSLLTDSYAWATSGDTRGHAQFWSTVLDRTLRPGTAAPWLQPVSRLPRTGHRIDLCRPAEFHCEPGYAEGPGWYQVDGAEPVYVYGANDWLAWQGALNRRATARAAMRVPRSASMGREPAPVFSTDLLFLALLMVAGALFLERKFRSR